MKKLLTLLLLTVRLVTVCSEEVLFLLPFCPISHKLIVDPIAVALGAKGHHVTFVSAFTFEKPTPANITEIVYPQFIDSFTVLQEILEDTIRYGWYPGIFTRYFDMHSELCRQFYDSGLLQKWTRSGNKFRVVLIDKVFTECLLPLWRNIAESAIILNTSPLSPMAVKLMGIPTPYSHVPHPMLPYTHRMTFIQRFINTLHWIMSSYVIHYSRVVVYNRVILPNFPDTQSYEDSVKNISLVLTNDDPILTRPRPHLPTVVPIGGIKCRLPKPLSESVVKTFIENSGDDGFILVSFGSILNGDSLGEKMVQTLVTAFSQIKQRVIWKHDSNTTRLSNNVLVGKWFPQADILGHPKIRAFINQGGVSSMHEALYNAVPQICFPLTSEQPVLVAAAADNGIAIPLDFRTFTLEELVNSINKASNDAEMRNNVQYYSKIFRDRQETPSETAVYWIEYVMKYNGALHLQSASADLNFVQYYLLDVYATLILIFGFIALFLWAGMKKLFQLLYPRGFLNVVWKIKVKLE
uniref:UDP-glycosyltransferase 212A1 n=1 Tax=Strigamia maritima TaxID=126957 RepID=T1IRJ7_STRMM|nr:UDP-glycosyltransferase 212A1 [Strigamia maritima]